MTCEIHTNDIGTAIRLNIVDCNDSALDVSDATAKYIKFKKPSGSVVTKAATFYTDGSDGIIQYVVESGVIDENGSWKVQGLVTVNDYEWHTSMKTFKVSRNIS